MSLYIIAKLLGAAGGLTNLSKMPANNIALLGQTKRASTGKKKNVRGVGLG